jgi:hypothetical protein
VTASLGEAVELPNLEPIFPYLGLVTMVARKPTGVRSKFVTHIPSLSIIRGSDFVEAPSDALPTANNVARTFQSNAINDNKPLSCGVIPLSPQDQAFKERRYWCLPVPTAAIFAALIERLGYDSSGCQAIRLACIIQALLVA